MAGSLGGMFSGQPPGPPPPPPGLPGQASLLQAAPGAPRPSNSTLVDELESSFEVSRAVGVPVQPSEVAPVSVVPAPRGGRGSESRSRLPEAGCCPCPAVSGASAPAAFLETTHRIWGLFGFQPAFCSAGPVGAGLLWSVAFRLSSSEFTFFRSPSMCFSRFSLFCVDLPVAPGTCLPVSFSLWVLAP